MDSPDALSRYIDIYILYVRTFTATAHARRYAQTYVAGQIWNRFSPAESAFSACIGIESDQLAESAL